MVKAVYISPDPADQATANHLGLGFVLDAAAQAHVQIDGGGQSIALPATATRAQVTAALQPLVDAETAASAAAATANGNADTLRTKAATALTTNGTYIALAAPSTAQTTAQVKALTRQMNALIRLQLGQLADISDT